MSGFEGYEPAADDQPRISDASKRYDIEFTLSKPIDPDVLALLYGGAPVPPQYAIEIRTPIPRKWWDRLLRRPQRESIIRIPHVELVNSDDMEWWK
jgi:hypothetical protein